MRRYADTFFRYWLIALVPILLLPLGDLLLTKPAPTVYGTANIWVDNTTEQQLSYVDPNAPPAQNMANYLGQLVLSSSFDMGVARRAPAYWKLMSAYPDPQNQVVTDLGKNLVAMPAGPNLVSISYTAAYPSVAVQVVRGVLAEASHQIELFNQSQTAKNTAFYTRQLKQAQAQYATAAQNLGNYMSTQGINPNQLDLRQLSDPKLATLYQAAQQAQTNVTNMQQALSKVQTQQTAAVSVPVIDAPAAKVTTLSKKKEITGLAIPLVIGLLLSGAFIVAKTAADKSLRYVDEVPDLLGLPVLTVVPWVPALAETSKSRKSLRKPSLGKVG